MRGSTVNVACAQPTKLVETLVKSVCESVHKSFFWIQCVDRFYVVKSDWFNFPFILKRHAIGLQILAMIIIQPIAWCVRMKGKLNQSDLITYNRSTQQDSEETFVHWFTDGFNQGFSSFASQATVNVDIWKNDIISILCSFLYICTRVLTSWMMHITKWRSTTSF